MASRSRNTESSAASDFMPENVPRDGTARHNWSSLAVPVREAPEREDEALGVLWRVKPATAHQLKLNAARYAADVIRYRRATNNHDGAARYAAPLEEVLAALPCPEPELRECVKDAEEDRLETIYRMNKCPETARPLILKRMEYLGAMMDDTRRIAALHGVTL